MTTHHIFFYAPGCMARHCIEADTAEQALSLARQLAQGTGYSELAFEPDDYTPIQRIEVVTAFATPLATWRHPELQLSSAAGDLLDALEAQTDAAQSVIDAWEAGDLAGAVRCLDELLPEVRAAIAKAKGGTP